jgi:hypothetical protein
MKNMNENGKHKLRRSDRIRKKLQVKLMEEDPYHFHKKQCKVLDVLERKCEVLEERVKVLEKDLAHITQTQEVKDEIPEEGIQLDLFILLIGFIFLFYKFIVPDNIILKYTFHPSIDGVVSV